MLCKDAFSRLCNLLTAKRQDLDIVFLIRARPLKLYGLRPLSLFLPTTCFVRDLIDGLSALLQNTLKVVTRLQ